MASNPPAESPGHTVVLHIIGSLDRGGAETLALDLVRRIPQDEVKQVFLCLSGRRGVLADEFETEGAIVVLGGGSPARQLYRFARIVRKSRADVVESHVALTSGWFLLLARLLGIRVRIARVHNTGDGRRDDGIRRIYRRLARWALSCGATSILAVSPGAKDFALAGTGSRMSKLTRVVPNGVDLSRFAYRGRTATGGMPTVIHIGRASPQKNRGMLAPIAKTLGASTSTAIQFLVVGAGGTEDLGDDRDRLIILGPRNDIPQLLRNADVLLLPSIREGLPGVVLEALASGVPVIASDISAMRSLSGLRGVELVSLDAPLTVWAEAIHRALAADVATRRAIADQMRGSPYSLDDSVATWKREWKVGLGEQQTLGR